MTTAVRSASETYVPSADHTDELAQVHDFLAAHEATGRGPVPERFFLASSAPGDRVELPAEVYGALKQVVEALKDGLAVTVAFHPRMLTTQQAADLLGISRPTLVKLLEKHEMPYEQVGTHRKVKVSDVLAYRERRRAAQYAALDATAVDIDQEEDLDTVLAELKETRHTAAARRRGARGG